MIDEDGNARGGGLTGDGVGGCCEGVLAFLQATRVESGGVGCCEILDNAASKSEDDSADGFRRRGGG